MLCADGIISEATIHESSLNMDTRIKISVIIPVYKVEKYIHQCVDSVLGQTYPNLEIILVDDGSPDRCNQICDEYANLDRRVIAIHQPNTGAGFARENGIKASSGDYVLLLDGDDWLAANAVEKCIQAVMSNESTDLVVFSFVKELPNRSIPVSLQSQAIGGQMGEDFHRRLYGPIGEELNYPGALDHVGVCWGKLYARKLTTAGRAFDLKVIGSAEDVMFNIYALRQCKNIVYLDECLYHYRKRTDSVSATNRPNLVNQWDILFQEMEISIQKLGGGKKWRDALSNRIALSVLGIGMNELTSKEHDTVRKISEIKRYINTDRYRKACSKLDIRMLPLPWKVLLFFSKYRCAVCVYLILYSIKILRTL